MVTLTNTLLLTILLASVTKAANVYQLIGRDKSLAVEQPFTSIPSKFEQQCISKCDHSPKCLSYAFNGQTCFLYDVMYKTTNGELRELKDEEGTKYHSTVVSSCGEWHAIGKRKNGYYSVATEIAGGQQRKEKVYCILDQMIYTTVAPTTTPVCKFGTLS